MLVHTRSLLSINALLSPSESAARHVIASGRPLQQQPVEVDILGSPTADLGRLPGRGFAAPVATVNVLGPRRSSLSAVASVHMAGKAPWGQGATGEAPVLASGLPLGRRSSLPNLVPRRGEGDFRIAGHAAVGANNAVNPLPGSVSRWAVAGESQAAKPARDVGGWC